MKSQDEASAALAEWWLAAIDAEGANAFEAEWARRISVELQDFVQARVEPLRPVIGNGKPLLRVARLALGRSLKAMDEALEVLGRDRHGTPE